jgi:hypothetical protein
MEKSGFRNRIKRLSLIERRTGVKVTDLISYPLSDN